MHSRVFVVLLSALVLCLTACAPFGKLDSFSAYSVNSDEKHKIYVFTDCLITSDLDGDGKFHELSVRFNTDLCQKLSKNIIDELSYKTDAEIISSGVTVGLQAGYNKYIKTVKGNLTLPVFVNKFPYQEQWLKRISNISEDLGVYVYGYDQRQEYVQSLVGRSYYQVVDSTGSYETLFVQINGVNNLTAHDEVDVSEVLLDAFLMLGGTIRVKYYPTSTRAVMLNSNGKVVWADVEFLTYSPVSDCQSENLSRSLFKYLGTSKDLVAKREWRDCTPIIETEGF